MKMHEDHIKVFTGGWFTIASLLVLIAPFSLNATIALSVALVCWTWMGQWEFAGGI